MGKFRVILGIATDLLSGVVIGIIVGLGLICLIPLALLFGVLFVIWMLGELCVWSIVDRSDNDSNDAQIGTDYADEND
jgi:hypothetical protein